MENDQKIEKKCYACGFPLEDYPYFPDSHPIFNESIICPSCGIHYGYDDGGAGDIIPDELAYSDWKFGDENHIKIMKFWRQYWIDGGMKWMHDDEVSLLVKPENWDPKKQLEAVPQTFK